jgi:outer membrane protein OmpA-like peptidoglycan-associated protein
MKKTELIIFPCVLMGLLSACSGSRVITSTNASFTEKDEVMIMANSYYAGTSVVGYGGVLADEEKKAVFKRKLKGIEGLQIRSVQGDKGNEFIAIVENNILFEHNKFYITETASLILGELASVLKEMPGTQVQVVGYTDNTGTDEYNLALSKLRASAVANYLRGLEVENVTEVGNGVQNPVASNDTEDGRRKNRRVEIKLSSNIL